MKKEMLRVNNLSIEDSVAEKLMNISICFLGGECVGFLGLENSGKNLLVSFICGEYAKGQINFYFDGVRQIGTAALRESVYKIAVSNYLIDDWTVAEYLFLVDSPFFSINRKKLTGITEELFHRFEIDISADKKLKKLSELEKRMADLMKAYSKGAKIIVIEDEFEGCSTQDIEKFKILLDRVVQKGITAVINSHSDNVSHILSDKYIIFNKGYVVKKCRKDFFRSGSYLENLLPGISSASQSALKKDDPEDGGEKEGAEPPSREVVFSACNMVLNRGKSFHMDFYKGEVATILALDLKEKTQIFELLSGRYIDKSMGVFLDHKPCNFKNTRDFIKSRIVSVADMGGESELLLRMSAGSNLMIPSLEKISTLQHALAERRVVKMLEKEVRNNLTVKQKNIKDMSVNDYILLLLERWYIYKPKVLILFEPFVHCDIFGISLVKSYVKKFTDMGAAVIVIKSREEYMEDISDRFIHI